MSVFFTSDLHVGHRTVAALRGYGYLNSSPDNDIRAHDNMLADNWDDTVKHDDVVWVLGDVSSGAKQAQLNALEWIKQRPGQKHLIAGNHDSCHPMQRDSHKWQRIYLDGVFESVQMAAKRRIPGNGGHVTVMLSHFPYNSDHTDESRYPEWRLNHRGFPLLHGHTHASSRLSFDDGFLGTPTKQVHVGVDAWDYRPVHLDEIVKLVQGR